MSGFNGIFFYRCANVVPFRKTFCCLFYRDKLWLILNQIWRKCSRLIRQFIIKFDVRITLNVEKFCCFFSFFLFPCHFEWRGEFWFNAQFWDWGSCKMHHYRKNQKSVNLKIIYNEWARHRCGGNSHGRTTQQQQQRKCRLTGNTHTHAYHPYIKCPFLLVKYLIPITCRLTSATDTNIPQHIHKSL